MFKRKKGKAKVDSGGAVSVSPEDARQLLAAEEEKRALAEQVEALRALVTRQESEHIEQTRKLLLGMLEFSDAFERVQKAIQSKEDQVTPQMRIWLGNLKAAYGLLRTALTAQNVTPIDNLVKGFDPHWHQILETVEDAAHADGAIVREEKKGYLWNGQLLRKSLVVVASNEQTVTCTAGDEPKE